MDRSELAAEFLADAPEPVRHQLAAAEDLPTFLRSAGTLTLDERKRLVNQAPAMLPGSPAATPLRGTRGVDSLTLRPLRIHLPPDEEWVTVGYIGSDGVERELRQPWLIADNLPPFVADADTVSLTAASLGVDLGTEDANRGRRCCSRLRSSRSSRLPRRRSSRPAPPPRVRR